MQGPDVAAIRPGEELDLDALAHLLDRCLPGPPAPLEAFQFPGGHSNLTYLLRRGGREYVLRRPPLGPVPPRAHDMAREAHILEKLAPLYPPAPRVELICEDDAVLGRPFYLMERRRGVILRREVPAEIAALPDHPQRIAEGFLDSLIELHSIDIAAHGLDRLGKPEGFLERQVQGWSRRWETARTRPVPAMERLSRWLLDHLPASPAPTMVHNDYKLDNVMLAEDDPGRIVAVLDWEMSSVGDPLVDLGVLLCYWPEPGDPPARREAISPVTTQPGWPSRAELLERYRAKTGRNLDGVAYYEVFGVFKLAVVLEQIYRRYHLGQTRDERFRQFEATVRGLADAAEVVQRTT
ncbi:MAG: phosphotransferase [Acidobacteria bacterium]|nr:phosphotransferase [Acidobacteriota bacterium]